MRIYKDIMSGDEMFSDTYKIKLVNEVIYEVYGKTVNRTQGEIEIAGFNPSSEGGDDEGADAYVETGVDIVLNHRLSESFAFPDKKSYTLYLKDYMKSLIEKISDKSPEEVEVFKKNINNTMKDILTRFKDLQFFTGESMDCEAMVALMEYRDIDGASVPVLMCFKHGLEEEKF